MDEENFDEGAAAINTSLNKTIVPSNLINLFNSTEFIEKALEPSTSQFWILLKTLKSYLDHKGSEGLLPLRPNLPDMFSDSDSYVRLLKVYRDRSQRDLDVFTELLTDVCNSLGIEQPDENMVKR